MYATMSAITLNYTFFLLVAAVILLAATAIYKRLGLYAFSLALALGLGIWTHGDNHPHGKQDILTDSSLYMWGYGLPTWIY